MSVFIKNFDMPKLCRDCRFSEWNGLSFWCIAKGGSPINYPLFENYKYKNCPLVEVSTPHGRLIDADKIEYHFEANENTVMEGCEFVTKGEIDRVPTVIKKEE